MNNRHSSYTGRYARTLEQAFGPYTSHQFDEPMPKADKLVTVGSLAVLAVFVVMVVMGWIK